MVLLQAKHGHRHGYNTDARQNFLKCRTLGHGDMTQEYVYK